MSFCFVTVSEYSHTSLVYYFPSGFRSCRVAVTKQARTTAKEDRNAERRRRADAKDNGSSGRRGPVSKAGDGGRDAEVERTA